MQGFNHLRARSQTAEGIVPHGIFYFSEKIVLLAGKEAQTGGEIDLVHFSYMGFFCVWSCNLDLEDRGAAIRKRW